MARRGAHNDEIREFRDFSKDYAFDPSPFNDEDPWVRRLKEIVAGLPIKDRVIILTYAECQSVRKLGERLHCSHTTAAKEVRRIRATIKEKFDKK